MNAGADYRGQGGASIDHGVPGFMPPLPHLMPHRLEPLNLAPGSACAVAVRSYPGMESADGGMRLEALLLGGMILAGYAQAVLTVFS